MYNSLFLYPSLPALLYFNNHKFLSKAERKGGFAWLQSQRNTFLTVQAKSYLHNLVSLSLLGTDGYTSGQEEQ